MHKLFLVAGAATLTLGAATAQAQTLDTSASRTVALAPTGAKATPRSNFQLQPLRTRAIAHTNADGSLAVRCEVERKPLQIKPADHSHGTDLGADN